MIRISKNQILRLHKNLIDKFGGVDGIRDEKLFDSAISSPFQTFGGQDLYPTLVEKAARLCYSLVKNHPFLDGNKRIGTHTMIVFLKANGINLKCSNTDLIHEILSVADNSVAYEDFLNWLEAHIENEN